VPALADLVDLHIERWETSSVEQGVFHTSEPEVVADQLEAFASRNLGASVREALFYVSSAGCVAGVVLHDGRRVVIKAYQSQWGRPFLSAVRRVQERLSEARFPCPRPIFGPSRPDRLWPPSRSWYPTPG
jgi:hypothetical protein